MQHVNALAQQVADMQIALKQAHQQASQSNALLAASAAALVALEPTLHQAAMSATTGQPTAGRYIGSVLYEQPAPAGLTGVAG